MFCLYLNYLILGGNIKSERTTATVLKFNSNNIKNKPVEMESMLYSRYGHACTIFKSALHDNRPIIIVAGSYTYYARSESNTAEVLDFTLEGTSWQESNLIFADIIFFFGIFQRWDIECIRLLT